MGAGSGSLPTTSLLADQRGRWDRGERIPVEEFLKKQPDLQDNTEVLLDLIYAEVVLRREAGERPTAEEYVARFPALAEPIRTQFEVDAMMGGSTQPAVVFDDRMPPPAPPGYEILEEIGRGGMGVVYKARHVTLDRLVALKMIRSGEFADPAERARFEAEARAVARLSHPNVIQIYEVGEAGGRPFLALEYVSGESLADALRGPPFLPRPAATLVATLARAVQHAHDAGVVHRDLKPANILLSKDEGGRMKDEHDTEQLDDSPTPLPSSVFVPKITDFGLAKQLGSDGLTRTGDFVGTPNFAAPEQAAGRADVGPAVDVYALGAILYQMLTGRPPFAGATALETLDQVRFTEPVPPSRLRPNLPRDIETITLTCLHKDPARRYSSAAALAEDLDRFLHGQAIRARPVSSMEKATKWCRRRPAIAGMLTAIVLLATASLITVTTLWQQAVKARDAEASAREDERTEQRKTAARSAELLIANARYAWTTDDIESARKSLAECPLEHRNGEWDMLNRICSASRLFVLPGPHNVDALAFNADGTRLAGGLSSGRVAVWDVVSGKELMHAQLPNRSVLSLAFNADGDVVGAMNFTFLSTDGKRRDNAEVTTVAVPAGKILRRHERPDRPIRFEMSSDGNKAACVSTNSRQAQIVDPITGKVLHEVECKTGNIMRLAISPNGRHVVTAALPQQLVVSDMESGQKRHEIVSPEFFFGFNPVAVFNDGQRVCIGAGAISRNVDLVILSTSQEPRRISSQMATVTALSVSPDGRWIACYTGSETLIRVFGVDTGRQEIVLRGHPASVRCFTFSPDSRYLAAGYRDGRVVIWDLQAK